MASEPYRLYLYCRGSIVCRHDYLSASDEDAGRLAVMLASACSDRCDELEVWQGTRLVLPPTKPDRALIETVAHPQMRATVMANATAMLNGFASISQSWRLRLLLQEWGTLDGASDLDAVIGEAIALTGADKANIQILDEQARGLRIAASAGFGQEFLSFFEFVGDEGSACAAALQRRQRVIVPDVAESPIFRGTAALQVMLRADCRSVQSTPLMVGHQLVGMLSTHRRTQWHVDTDELKQLDGLAATAAPIIEVMRRSA